MMSSALYSTFEGKGPYKYFFQRVKTIKYKHRTET
uniref:Uncharacterized protein n=1 Tax=Arundo donax TaxID=35708 RepID=A0A0A9HFZ1_ARUDO